MLVLHVYAKHNPLRLSGNDRGPYCLSIANEALNPIEKGRVERSHIHAAGDDKLEIRIDDPVVQPGPSPILGPDSRNIVVVQEGKNSLLPRHG